MKFRIELIIADDAGQEQQRIVALEKPCTLGDVSRSGLGLTVADSKSLLGTVQQHLIKTEVQAMSGAHAACPHCLTPMKRKDVRPVVYRTLFGKYTLDNERLFTCGCQDSEKKSFSPLNDAIVTRTHPELSYFQARWASLISYQQSLRLLEDVFPIEGAISLTNMKIKVPQIGQRIESEREVQTKMITPASTTIATVVDGESAAPRRYVGVDAGYVKSTEAIKKGACKFGVIAVKTVEKKSRCHAYVQGEVDNGSERIVRFVEQGEDSPPAALTFFTDAGADIKAATSPDGKNYQRILDWFHLAMYFQIAFRTATPLKDWRYNEKYTIAEEIERIKWKLWHGQHQGAIERLWLLACWIGLHKSTQLKDKLANRLFDLFYYLDNNADCLVHYSKRKQNGLPVSSAMAESAVNQIISRRFVKKQQMRWAPKSAHQLLQVRTAVLNDELVDHFKRWHPGFSMNDPTYKRAA